MRHLLAVGSRRHRRCRATLNPLCPEGVRWKIRNPKYDWRISATVAKVRRREMAPEVTRSLGEVLSSHWRVAEDSMRDTARLYDDRCRSGIAAP